MLNRRRFLATAGIGLCAAAVPASARSQPVSMRGAIDATGLGVRPGAAGDQTNAFSAMLAEAAARDMAVFLPPGDYVVSRLVLPRNVRLSGVPGATRLVFAGGGHLAAEGAEHIALAGISFDGGHRPLAAQARALIDLRQVRHAVIDDCAITASGHHGLSLERVGGRVERSTVTGAAEAGIYSVDAAGLAISGNTVSDCANGGILVHRWQVGEDGTLVTGNRVERIAARHGGTGQFGNGINTYRAGNVTVSSNMVSDCAFSAIRANASSNIQIVANKCLRSGETALYAEFAFEGSVISSNIVDGAANGISIVNFNEGGRMAVCSGNLVRNMSVTGPYPADPPGFGVGITVEADTAVTGNVVESAPRYGIHVGWGPFMRNVVATGNVIRQVGEGIAVSVVEGTGSAILTDNVIQEAERGAVVGHRWTEAVTGDLTVEGAARFPNLVVERNRAG